MTLITLALLREVLTIFQTTTVCGNVNPRLTSLEFVLQCLSYGLQYMRNNGYGINESSRCQARLACRSSGLNVRGLQFHVMLQTVLGTEAFAEVLDQTSPGDATRLAASCRQAAEYLQGADRT